MIPCPRKTIRLTNRYTISFDYKPVGTINAWTNIFRITESNENCCKPNDRKPALFIHANTFKFHFTISTEAGGNIALNPAFNFEAG